MDSINADCQGLLLEAYLLAEDVVQQIGASTYEKEIHSAFNNVEFPILNVNVFTTKILELLYEQGRLIKPFTISVSRTKVSNETMGMLLRYDPKNDGEQTHFSIRINDALNLCWSRFVQVKEVCQLYCDIEKQIDNSKAISLKGQVYDLLIKQKALDTESDIFSIQPTDENYTEFLSFFMAVNIIFPQSFRADFDSLTTINASGQHLFKLYDIANVYKMPEYLTKLFRKMLLPFYVEKGF